MHRKEQKNVNLNQVKNPSFHRSYIKPYKKKKQTVKPNILQSNTYTDLPRMWESELKKEKKRERDCKIL